MYAVSNDPENLTTLKSEYPSITVIVDDLVDCGMPLELQYDRLMERTVCELIAMSQFRSNLLHNCRRPTCGSAVAGIILVRSCVTVRAREQTGNIFEKCETACRNNALN